MMTITYVIDNKLYLNITNKCPCACEFCIRRNGEGAYGSDSLWLEHQPDAEEVIDALKKENLDSYDELYSAVLANRPVSWIFLLKRQNTSEALPKPLWE